MKCAISGVSHPSDELLESCWLVVLLCSVSDRATNSTLPPAGSGDRPTHGPDSF